MTSWLVRVGSPISAGMIMQRRATWTFGIDLMVLPHLQTLWPNLNAMVWDWQYFLFNSCHLLNVNIVIGIWSADQSGLLIRWNLVGLYSTTQFDGGSQKTIQSPEFAECQSYTYYSCVLNICALPIFWLEIWNKCYIVQKPQRICCFIEAISANNKKLRRLQTSKI